LLLLLLPLPLLLLLLLLPDLEEFDRSVEGRSKDGEDARAVPPCYKVRL
jgi:hypothetical protein